MATRTATISDLGTHGNRAHTAVWTGLLNGDDGSPVELFGSTVRSVQVTGTFGVGGTVVLEGSNDGTNYITLTDPQGNAISKNAASIEAIEEATRYIRPRVTAGDGTTSLVVTVFFRRNF